MKEGVGSKEEEYKNSPLRNYPLGNTGSLKLVCWADLGDESAAAILHEASSTEHVTHSVRHRGQMLPRF